MTVFFQAPRIAPPASTLQASLRTHARRRPGHPAVICGSRVVTYAELERRSNRTANALAAAGAGAGTRVAHLARDSELYYDLLYGCAKVGAVLVPIDWRLTAPEVDHVLRDSGARLLFFHPASGGLVAGIAPGLPQLREAIPLDAAGFGSWRDGHPSTFRPGGDDPQASVAQVHDDAPGAAAVRVYRDNAGATAVRVHEDNAEATAVRVHEDNAEAAAVRVHRDDPEAAVVQVYTSGTTGAPKGVVLAQRTFFAVAATLAEHGLDWIDWRPYDRSLVGVPGFHIGGIWWATQGLNAGVTNVVLPAFDSLRAVRLIRDAGITTTCMVPAMLRMLVDEPGVTQAYFVSLRKVVYGGSPISDALLQRCIDTFDCDLAQIYGLTETGNTAVCLPPSQHRPGSPRMAAAGRPYPGVRVRIVDGTGAELPAGATGQVLVHTPARMIGYWNQPEKTAATLVDGWVRTGDAGYLDQDGYLYICDRITDMIIVGGENVYPAEVEKALSRHPDVIEAAVVGAPDPTWGEQVHAFIAARRETTGPELTSFLRGTLAQFKIPTRYEFVDAVPRNPSGKILRRKLRDPLWAGRNRKVN